MKNLDKPLKVVSLDEMIDKHIGEIGTKRRDTFEKELTRDLLGEFSPEREFEPANYRSV